MTTRLGAVLNPIVASKRENDVLRPSGGGVIDASVRLNRFALHRSIPMKNSLYDQVTRTIISEMESGILPWERPWADGKVVEPARNALTGRGYSGINVLLLWDAVCQHGFSTNRWMTFNQARRVAGGVRRHQKGTRIVFAARYLPRAEKKKIEAGVIQAHEAETRFHTRAYSVFNLDQIVDPPDRLWPNAPRAESPARHEQVSGLARSVGAVIRIGGNDAYYHHLEDYIAIPPTASFLKSDDYCSTLLHELTHWTGHESRLHRPFGQVVTDAEYIHEELIAELGAAYLSANYGIRPQARHSDYIAYWLTALRTDSGALFRAAKSASDAADFLLMRAEGKERVTSSISPYHRANAAAQHASPSNALRDSRTEPDESRPQAATT